jgi:ABC-type branched-subunit amino acid transport system substrate-binding protein/predicted negative regulator of RcsB-dependent stress response
MRSTRLRFARPRARLLAAVCAALALAACAGAGSLPRKPVADARDAYRAALRRADEDPAAGARALERFLASYPRSDLADDAALALARLELGAGRDAAAVQRLRDLLRSHPDGDAVDPARLLLARTLFEQGDAESAERHVAKLRLSKLAEDERDDAYRLQSDLARARGDRVGELRWLAQVRAAAEREEVASIDREMDALIARMDLAELRRTAAQLGPRAPAARVRARAAELALFQGDREAARSELIEASLLPLTPAEAERIAALEARLAAPGAHAAAPTPERSPPPATGRHDAVPSTQGVAARLGVLLPLSGSLARFGEEALHGVLLAAGLFDAEGQPGSRVELVVRDTGSDPDRAAAGFAELAAAGTLAAVVGPLSAREAEAAAAAADGAALPLVTLTPRRDVTQGRAMVLALGLRPEDEVARLADDAFLRLGLRRFSILYPEDAPGRGMRELFERAVVERGGEVVSVSSYDTGLKDFGGPIRRLGGARAVAASPPGAAPSGPGWDALFIPDVHARVELIAPQLAFHAVDGARLLGLTGWHHPDLLRIGGRHVEGAVFTEAFDPDASSALVQEFRRRFRASFESEPGAMAAQAFDATQLVLLAILRGAGTPQALREALAQVVDHPGMSGRLSILPDGTAKKRPYLLEVRGQRIVAVD